MKTVSIRLINDYNDGRDNGIRKSMMLDIREDATIKEIIRYLEEREEYNMEDMWCLEAEFFTLQHNLQIYHNETCLVLKELNPEEYDRDDLGVDMWEVEFSNGVILEVFEDELRV